MAFECLSNCLCAEAIAINAAIQKELDNLPAPCQPVARHIIGSGGKRLRPFLTVITARMFGYHNADIYRLASSLEMLHAATLLHDDVLDAAAMRRKQPTAHTLYGVHAAILGGDALLALGNKVVASFANPVLSRAYSCATMETAAGEVKEMAALHDPTLSYADYLAIAAGKTGCLIAQACVMGAAVAATPLNRIELCQTFGENLGIAFQLVDDALDFAPQEQTGKPRGGDLREGKLTPPLYLYRNSLATQERQKFDLAFRAGSFEDAEKIIAAASAFIPKTLELADELLRKAKDALRLLPDNQENAILAGVVEYVRDRRN